MKTTEQSEQNDIPSDEEKSFAEYLRQHPDFFARHASLLSQLIIPHPSSGQAVSLLERQVMVLREQQDSAQRKLRDLINNAKNNDRLNRRMERLTLHLLGQRSLDHLIQNLPHTLKNIFELEYVTLRLTSPIDDDPTLPDLPDACCPTGLSEEQRNWLFDGDSTDVESFALVTLKLGKQVDRFAVLALGSSDKDRYHPRSGTHFIEQLQRLLSASITQLQQL